MDLTAAFQAAFTQALSLVGEEIVYTSRSLAADSSTCNATLERLGPDDEHYNDRVGSRYAVEILVDDLTSDAAGDALTPAKHDKLVRDDGQVLKVIEVSREWGGLYHLVAETDGRPDAGKA